MGKAVVCFAILLAVLSDRGLCSSSLKEFYVKPTGSRAECPSPCHSLQDYADNSSFTANNSKFIFLEGEHHLGTVVHIRNVANLSMVGASSRVKILCVTMPSGFHIEEFVSLNIENMTILNCREKNSSIYLGAGSDVSFKCVNLSSNLSTSDLWYKAVITLTTVNVVGTFVVSDSSFLAYSPDDIAYYGLYMIRNAPSNSPILIKNNVFAAPIQFHYTCGTNDCSQDSVEFTNNTFIDSSVVLANGGSVVMRDAVFSGLSTFSFMADPESTDTTLLAATLQNISFDEVWAYLYGVAIWFVNCTFENNVDGPAITAVNSRLVFEGDNVFRNNTSLVGGAIALHESSTISLEPYTHILFVKNHANYVGGAIYTNHTASDKHCFFDASSGIDQRQVTFIGNAASFGGSSLYGGLQGCSEEVFDAVFDITNTEADPSAIASDPYKVCLCESDKHQPDCSREISVSVFPGQVFSLRLAVVGASPLAGVVPGAIHAFFFSHEATLDSSQVTQISDQPYCYDFNYSVYGTEYDTVTLNLAPEPNFLNMLFGIGGDYMTIGVQLKECPAGFSFSNTSGSCVCEPSFERYNILCDINDQSYVRPVNSWLGFMNESSTELVVAFARNCPLGYCKPDVVNITLNNSNTQCEPHRTGLLCGKCDSEGGYSLTLGNGRCAMCSNTYLLHLFPLALAGLLLVVVLFALNLTVTEGSINGLIFYANVLSMSNAVQFSERGSQYLYTFLAWLNLDLGIATCLYDGMDGYSETWLEFVFPAYLLLIIIAIIIFYRQFPAFAHRVCGENAVKVIATPLLLFYTKLQRTVVTIMSFTVLEYSNGSVRYAWLYDANVKYFKGKHLYLGIAGTFVLVFIILPYALCLTFFQQLQACSGHKLFQWANKLKPVFDAYAGPYNDKYRFWTGMLLLVRTLLIILFTINYAASVEVNLLIISVVSCALLIAQSNGILYKKWPSNFLESFFYGQLIVFSVGTVYARHSDFKNITIVADISIALTLLVFLAVLGYHVINRMHAFKRYCYHFKGYADIEEDIPHSREIDSIN